MDDVELRCRLESAQANLLAARFDDALALVADWPTWPPHIGQYAALVVAGVKLRRDGADALGFLAPLGEFFEAPEAKFRRELELARAYGMVRNFDGASLCVDRAAAMLAEYPQGRHRLSYVRAAIRGWQNQLSLDDSDLALALQDADPNGRLAALTMRSWIHASRREYAAQIADLVTALESCFAPGRGGVDMSTAALAAVSLARIAFETANRDGIEAATRGLEELPWTPDIDEYHMHVLRCLGLDAFMRGESGRAQWLFRDALKLAPSPAFRAQCHLDRALVARISDNEPWALDEIFEAEREATSVAWGNTFGEERMLLSIFAEMYAPVDTSRAHYYAAAYSRLGMGNISPQFAMSRDPRAAALDLYARGLIEQTLGDKALATATFESVYETFAAIRHHYRAATAAISLYELTGASQWKESAQAHIEAYGETSPLANKLAARTAAADPLEADFTPFQRQLLKALVMGEDSDRLSRRFSRSTFTISKQVEYIYARLHVDSVHGLRREVKRRGIA